MIEKNVWFDLKNRWLHGEEYEALSAFFVHHQCAHIYLYRPCTRQQLLCVFLGRKKQTQRLNYKLFRLVGIADRVPERQILQASATIQIGHLRRGKQHGDSIARRTFEHSLPLPANRFRAQGPVRQPVRGGGEWPLCDDHHQARLPTSRPGGTECPRHQSLDLGCQIPASGLESRSNGTAVIGLLMSGINAEVLRS